MHSDLCLSPRYTLDDELPWLIGIDPVRRYWIKVNGDPSIPVTVPGFMIPSLTAFKEAILNFRSMEVGSTLTLPTFTSESLKIHHLATNLYAVPYRVKGAQAWHLFDRETVEALLLAAHPDWQCAPQDVALGRNLVWQSWQQTSATKTSVA